MIHKIIKQNVRAALTLILLYAPVVDANEAEHLYVFLTVQAARWRRLKISFSVISLTFIFTN